jgi:hypothetical protein
MILNNKENCTDYISASVRRSAIWRRALQSKYPDPRNGRAADKLERLADEIYEMTDEEFSQIAPHYSWSSGAWSDAVSQVSRLVGYRGVDTVPAFISHLVGILSQNEIAA